MTQSGMLFLDKKRRKSHFDAANTIKLTALIPAVLFLVFILKGGITRLGTLVIVCTVMTLSFLLASYLIYWRQQTKLKLISFDTSMSQSDNYAFVKKTLYALQWTMAQDTSNFIEAYNPHRDIRTWGNEMVSVVILDSQILLNSICNLDAMNQIMFTFGKNRQNVNKFIETFGLITQNTGFRR
ncbi:hypothetical protein QTN47_21370 [Danxiaibacter flavus]|uniref:Uncharacterized protein n=1 Tax=Danxiaibacter flavus TaxID=3049108 RepID=A0ABV3ZJV1_9BACT|nr:hypothetical protein QNM32_21375 [Chitinophagaceae bacterium DXS]